MESNNLHKNNIKYSLIQKILRMEKIRNKKFIVYTKVHVLILTILCITLSVYVLDYDKIYSGVYIHGEAFGKMTKEEALDKFDKVLLEKIKKDKITLKSDSDTISFSMEDIGINYNRDDVVNKIYSMGRDGNFINRIFDLVNLKFNENNVSYVDFKINDLLLDKYINEFYKKTYVKSKEYSYKLDEKSSSIIINSGTPEKKVNKETLKERILDKVLYGETEDFFVERDIIKQKKIDVDDTYKKLNIDSKNATVKLINLKSYELVEEKDGVEIDKTVLTNKINEINQMDNKNVNIPVDITKPSMNIEQLKNKVFKDLLATYQTSFGANYSRNTNISLASAAINNSIIMPGEKFSFNGIVGQRTAAKGYQSAPVYANGEVTTGIGGGICQVSTTLHNVALRIPYIEIVQRQSHMFPVNYVPYGYDATVSYGSVDYVFKNNSNYPIRINIYISGGTLNASITGTKENNRTVSLFAESTGLTFYVYRTIKDGEKVISKETFTSSYRTHP
ncbi:MAG: VanW family protein [Clostridiales bacterium]